jgi:hypothetical protein
MEVKATYVKMMLFLVIIFLLFGVYTVIQLNQNTSSAKGQVEGFTTETSENCALARAVYLQRNPDVAQAGIDAWTHYTTMGRREGRKWPSCQLETPTLNFCPFFAPQIQTAKGYTDCCQGDKIDGKCNGTTFCTLSPMHDGIPVCIDAWKKYFLEKGQSNCPTTMPFYFEDIKTTGGSKGCSASPTNTIGSQPENGSMPRCIIYPTEKENREKADSCFVEREKLNVKCPVYQGNKGVASVIRNGNTFSYYVCRYTIPGQLAKQCNEDKTSGEYLKKYDPNWRNRANVQENLDLFCSNFVTAERRKEVERQRIEEEKRKREQAERLLQEQQTTLRNAEQARKDAEAKARRDATDFRRRIQEMQARLNRCRR